ncbi:MAG: chemotaxis protein CheW [Planctomycetota bacterium]|jgi:chemotaxis signal transduction protein
MVEVAAQTDRQVWAATDAEGEFFTFGFFAEDDGLALEFLGWQPFQLTPGKGEHLKGVLHLLGREIPVIDPKVAHGNGVTEMTEATCIVVFEYPGSYKRYLGMVVEGVDNVMDIAGEALDCANDLMCSCEVILG